MQKKDCVKINEKKEKNIYNEENTTEDGCGISVIGAMCIKYRRLNDGGETYTAEVNKQEKVLLELFRKIPMYKREVLLCLLECQLKMDNNFR